jgi:hypothetical protein
MQLTEAQKLASEKQFYVSALHTFGVDGNSLLALLDDILSGDLEWFDPTV